MTRARRGRVNLLGIDPSYTRQAEREGRGVEPTLSTATATATSAEAAGVGLSEARAAQPVASPHEAKASKRLDAGPKETEAPPAALPAAEDHQPPSARATAPRFARQVRFSLSPEGTERLKAVSRDQGVPMAVITKALRGRVSADLHRLLEAGQRPDDQRVYRGGHAERILIRLEGAACQRARAWFDPMDFGDDALADAMRPVLARLFEDHLRRLGGA